MISLLETASLVRRAYADCAMFAAPLQPFPRDPVKTKHLNF